MNKKAFELQFHWIFILIAGALILAFFFTVANKQKNLSQEKLQLTLATEIDNIFTGAIISRGTAQKVPTPPQGITFECTQGCECNYGIGQAKKEFGNKPMFAPKKLDGEITVWAQEFKQPFRATNFLFLTSPNIKYYFVYDNKPTSQSLLNQITKNIPPLIEYEKIESTQMTSIKEEKYQHTKFVLLDVNPTTLDDTFKKASYSAIKIDSNGITFYEQDGTTLRQVKYLPYTGLTNIYAAIFAENDQMYECGLKTAFKKLSQISQLYMERAQELQQNAINAGKDWCYYGTTTDTSTPIGMLQTQYENAKKLSNKLDYNTITDISALTQQLDTANRNFIQQSCPEMF